MGQFALLSKIAFRPRRVEAGKRRTEGATCTVCWTCRRKSLEASFDHSPLNSVHAQPLQPEDHRQTSFRGRRNSGSPSSGAPILGREHRLRRNLRTGEVALHGDFKARIIEDVLGYTRFGVGEPWSCSAERQMGRGPVDLALGEFRSNSHASSILAAIELKGADTKDLDAIMPGRNLTPVQQAWQYAVAVKGCRWVLVSNYVELRLYAFGQGTQHYELFNSRS